VQNLRSTTRSSDHHRRRLQRAEDLHFAARANNIHDPQMDGCESSSPRSRDETPWSAYSSLPGLACLPRLLCMYVCIYVCSNPTRTERHGI